MSNRKSLFPASAASAHNGFAVVVVKFNDSADGYQPQAKIHRTPDEAAARALADAHRGENTVTCVVRGDHPSLKRLNRRHPANGRR
jgi:hypothetical protein